MVRHHPEPHVVIRVSPVGASRELRHLRDDRIDLVRLVHVRHALAQVGDAFQAAAGVNVLRGQGFDHVEFVLGGDVGDLLLLKDQVPDLQETVLVGLRPAVGTELGSAVYVDLGAGATRAGHPHVPVVVLEATLLDAAARDPGLPPQRYGLLVAVQCGHPHLVGPKPETAVGDLGGDQLPGVVDGAFLEVIAECEVPHHLEERAVPGGPAHVVYVQGAHTLLNGDRAAVGGGFLPHEIGFEGHHPGVDEQQGGVVVEKRRARHDGVVVAREEIDEPAPDLGGFHWRVFLGFDVSQAF